MSDAKPSPPGESALSTFGDLVGALPSTSTRVVQHIDTARDRREAVTAPWITLSVTRPQAERQLGSFLFDDDNPSLPALDDALHDFAKEFVGKDVPPLEEDAKVLARLLLEKVVRGRHRLLHEDGVDFPREGPRPDTFVMDRDFVAPKGETQVPVARAFAECAGILEWKRADESASSGQAAQYIQQMLASCPWRESAVVVTYGVDKAQVHVGCAWRHGRHRVRILRSRKWKVFVLAGPKDKRKINEVHVDGLRLLQWGVDKIKSVRLSEEAMKALWASTSTRPYAASLDDPPAVNAVLLGVGTSASVCSARASGNNNDAVVCIKTVRDGFLSHVEIERTALEKLPKCPSFPRLLAAVSPRLFTTPVVEPLCPSTGDKSRRICQFGFAAYALLVEDLKVMHREARVYHCDMAPHNVGWYWLDEGGQRSGRLFLMDFGCAVMEDESSETTVPYSGSLWFASTSALRQLIDGMPSEAGEERRGNVWMNEVKVDATFDLEGLVKSVAALEVPRVADFIDDFSEDIYQQRKKTESWTGFRPRDVERLWVELPTKVPQLQRLQPLFDAARRADGHNAVAAGLRRLSVEVMLR